MTFVRKHSGDRTRPIIAEYSCPQHGEFDAVVVRDENGEAPDRVKCPDCAYMAPWTPSAVDTRVRRVEAVRGKSEKPERKTWTDTRAIAEGQPLYEWREDRAKIWEEKRKQDVVEFAREHNERVIGGD